MAHSFACNRPCNESGIELRSFLGIVKLVHICTTGLACRFFLHKRKCNSALSCSMFSREEASRIRHEFWTTFGRYMSPVRSAEGLKINWVNYHTRIKDLYFRMDAGAKSAMISISIEHRDDEIQQLFFEKFEEFKTLLHETLQEEWQWQLHASVDGKTTSRIFTELPTFPSSTKMTGQTSFRFSNHGL